MDCICTVLSKPHIECDFETKGGMLGSALIALFTVLIESKTMIGDTDFLCLETKENLWFQSPDPDVSHEVRTTPPWLQTPATIGHCLTCDQDTKTR